MTGACMIEGRNAEWLVYTASRKTLFSHVSLKRSQQAAPRHRLAAGLCHWLLSESQQVHVCTLVCRIVCVFCFIIVVILKLLVGKWPSTWETFRNWVQKLSCLNCAIFMGTVWQRLCPGCVHAPEYLKTLSVPTSKTHRPPLWIGEGVWGAGVHRIWASSLKKKKKRNTNSE